MDLIIYWRFESPGRISDLMLYFHLSHRPYKCTPLNPRYAPLYMPLHLCNALCSLLLTVFQNLLNHLNDCWQIFGQKFLLL